MRIKFTKLCSGAVNIAKGKIYEVDDQEWYVDDDGDFCDLRSVTECGCKWEEVSDYTVLKHSIKVWCPETTGNLAFFELLWDSRTIRYVDGYWNGTVESTMIVEHCSDKPIEEGEILEYLFASGEEAVLIEVDGEKRLYSRPTSKEEEIETVGTFDRGGIPYVVQYNVTRDFYFCEQMNEWEYETLAEIMSALGEII